MSPAITLCPHCAAPVATNSLQGLCPHCVAGLSLGSDTALGEGDARAAATPLTPAELAPFFPKLEILECLGRGGMGVVYKARQKALNRLVALKLLAPERVTEPAFEQRFVHEARALAALSHPNIVTVYEFGESEGLYFLIMELVDGVNLREARMGGCFTPEQALALVPPVCEALQYAHEHGIVHRDIKPENLLLDKGGRVMIADFGIARMLHAEGPEIAFAESQPAGTPQYMAPEQRERQAADHRADIYSLGVVLYELLTGELPRGPLETALRAGRLEAPLHGLVQRALQERPELRFQSAAELRTHAETILSSPGRTNARPIVSAAQSAGTDRSAARSLRLPRPGFRRWLLAAGPVALAAVVAFLVPRPLAIGADSETVDFDSGALTDAFHVNVLFGSSPYALAPVGVNHTQGIDLPNSLASEGTLVFQKKSYNLAQLSTLEVSCLFRRQAIGAGTQALSLGLVQTPKGHLSGVKGDAWVALRLSVAGESLRLQFQSKEAAVAPPHASKTRDDFKTEPGQWYQLKAIFSRVDEKNLRVTGEVHRVSDAGVVGEQVGFFPATNFWIGDFPFGEILESHETWVALRASGAGGADALDNFEVKARPVPAKAPAQ